MSSNNILTSVYGRRLGLQLISSSVTGQSTSIATAAPGRTADLLAGPDAFKEVINSTKATTTYSLTAFGIDILTTNASAATTAARYILDKPIPGVHKYIIFPSSQTAVSYQVVASTDASICFDPATTGFGSTNCIITSSDGGRVALHLLGINSTRWAILSPCTTSAIRLCTESS